ncbi:MAG: LVIVD repeat-containing protein [Candidatus Odinarchaeota archaeon]
MKKISRLLAVSAVIAFLISTCFVSTAVSQASDQGQLTFKKLGQIDTGSNGNVKGVEVIGNIAYVADFCLGFKTYDISNPKNPLELDTLDHPNYYDPDAKGGHSLVIRNDTAIVDFTHGGIKLVNISDPADLREIGSFYISGVEYYGLILDGDLVYTVVQHRDERDELLLIDISDIADPIEAGRYSNGHSIAIDHAYEGFACVHDENIDKLLCLDVTDPTNVTEISGVEYFGTEFLSDVEISGNQAYVGSGGQRLSIYDMSTLSAPLLLAQHDIGYAPDVDLAGDLVFAALFDRGFKVFNASGTDLVEIGHYNSGGESINVCVQNSIAYVAKFLTQTIEIVQIQGLAGETRQTPGFDLHLFVFLTIPCLVTIRWKRKSVLE